MFTVENKIATVTFQHACDMLGMFVHCGTKSKRIPLLLENDQARKVQDALDQLKVRNYESFDFFTMVVAGCAQTIMKSRNR